jgi:hypothetical protein
LGVLNSDLFDVGGVLFVPLLLVHIVVHLLRLIGLLQLGESEELQSGDKDNSDGIHLLVSHSFHVQTVVRESKIVGFVEPGNLIKGD